MGVLGSSVHMRSRTRTQSLGGVEFKCGYITYTATAPRVWGTQLWTLTDHLISFPNTIEIDITCWDADPVPEEEEGFEGGD